MAIEWNQMIKWRRRVGIFGRQGIKIERKENYLPVSQRWFEISPNNGQFHGNKSLGDYGEEWSNLPSCSQGRRELRQLIAILERERK